MRRLIGFILLALALAVIAWEALGWFNFGEWRLILFGDIAFQLFPETLNLAQAVIQRYVWDYLWDPILQGLLLWPAWPPLAVLGLIFWAWGTASRRRR